MTTVWYHRADDLGLVFVEWTRTSSVDPDFSPLNSFVPEVVVINGTRWVCRVGDWDGIYFPISIAFEAVRREAWIDASRMLWERLLLVPQQQTMKAVAVTINYNAIKLFTALCGNETIVKKVIK